MFQEREKRRGKHSSLATSREDIREAHTILAYCFTDLTRSSLPSFLSILAQFPKPKLEVTLNRIKCQLMLTLYTLSGEANIPCLRKFAQVISNNNEGPKLFEDTAD